MKKFKVEAFRLWNAWSAASPGTYGAAVAYYTVFSLAPLVIIAVSVAGLVFNTQSVRAQVLIEFSNLFGANGATLISSLIQVRTPAAQSILATCIGVVLVIAGALGIFSGLRSAFNVIFSDLPEKRVTGIWKIVVQYVISVSVVFGVGFLLIASLILTTVLTKFGNVLDEFMQHGTLIVSFLETVISYGLISIFLAILLALLPSKHIPRYTALKGGLVAGLLFMIGKYALGIYFAYSKAGSAYGTASTIVLIILWTYYLSQALFLSAIIADLYFVPINKKLRTKK
jgi:membrane protein